MRQEYLASFDLGKIWPLLTSEFNTTLCSQYPVDFFYSQKSCKTVLDENGIAWDKNWDVGQMTGETLKLLKLMPKDIPDKSSASTEIKAILGNLRAIATNLAALRNPYGSGHGKSSSYKGLEERHAKLAVGSSITLVSFLWDTHEKRISLANP